MNRLDSLSKEAREEYWASLALRHCAGLGARSQAKLLKKFETAASACRSFRKWPQLGLPAASAEYYANGSWNKEAKKEWDCALKSSAQILLWGSPQYPGCLRELPDAPILLYCRGADSLLASPCLAIVGSRNPTAENMRIAGTLARAVADCGITVVSGMALGIDREAHLGAIAGIGRSIGVLGAGIDVEYPRSNRDVYELMRRQGLLVSEFPPNSPPAGCNFPIRNRIISGLSLGVLVVEAAVRSGSLITARLALEQNREVFAVPGSALNEHSIGCQNLVRQGARPVFNVDDILRDLADRLYSYGIAPQEMSGPEHSSPIQRANTPELPGAPPLEVVPTEAKLAASDLLDKTESGKVLEVLRACGQLHTDIILAKTGLNNGQLSTALLALEMLGQIRRLPGSHYEAI